MPRPAPLLRFARLTAACLLTAAIPVAAAEHQDFQVLRQAAGRWWDARTGRIVAFGETTPLGRDLAAGQSVHAQVGLSAPKTPGDYVVEIGLVQQGRGWLGDVAGGTPFLARGRVRVIDARPAA